MEEGGDVRRDVRMLGAHSHMVGRSVDWLGDWDEWKVGSCVCVCGEGGGGRVQIELSSYHALFSIGPGASVQTKIAVGSSEVMQRSAVSTSNNIDFGAKSGSS